MFKQRSAGRNFVTIGNVGGSIKAALSTGDLEGENVKWVEERAMSNGVRPEANQVGKDHWRGNQSG